MNDSQIETLLRHAPKITAPVGLLMQLQADITLPRQLREHAAPFVPWFKRLAPVISFGLFVLGCLVAIAIQTNELATLRRDNQSLQQTADAEQAARAEGESKAAAAARSIEMLRKDQQELQNLQAEIEQLRQTLAQVPDLQAQAEKLRDQFRAQSAAALTNSDDPFAAARSKADSLRCVNNMKQIGLAVRMWANDHQEMYPPDFLAIRQELNTPKVLVCPVDEGNLSDGFSWEGFDPSRTSYDYFGTGQTEASGHEWVLTRCRIHGHVGLCDGSVQMVNPGRARIVSENGRFKLVWQ